MLARCPGMLSHRDKEMTKFVPILSLLLCGCVTPFRSAGCIRQHYPAFNVLACADSVVAAHCLSLIQNQGHKDGKPIPRAAPGTNDDGSPVTVGPRGCAHKSFWLDTKPTILIGKSYLSCVTHETCHALNWATPEGCAKMYPCLGEK